MSLPIVFIHKNASWYLWYSLRQAQIWNPQAEVVLLTDTPNGRYPEGVRVESLADYAEAGAPFAAVYRHFSTNTHDFELFSFQRWFVLQAWMQRHQIERCFYQDSDVLVYADVAAELRRLGDFSMSVTKRKGPQHSFINQRHALDAFCSYLYESYAQHGDEIARRYEEYRATHRYGGICDMTLLEAFADQPGSGVIDLFTIRDNAIFDNNVSVSEGFATTDDSKCFTWRNQQPHSRYLQTNQPIRFAAIHFQGPAKSMIPDFSTRKDLAFYQQLCFRTPPQIVAVRMLRKVVRTWIRNPALPSVSSS